MLNTGNYRAHLGVFWKTQRILILIFFTVLIVNICLQTIMSRTVGGGLLSFNISAILPTIVGVLIGILFAIPIMEVTSIPYLLTLGSRRKDILISASLNNLLFAGFVTLSLSGLLGIYILTTNDLAPIYMGIFIEDWSSLLIISILNLFLFFILTTIIFFIGTVFHRWGLMLGLGVLLFLLSFPVWLLKEIYEFYIFGGTYFSTFIGLFLIGILFLTLNKAVLSKIEIRHHQPRFQLKGFTFFVCMIILFSASIYWGTERLITNSATLNDSGRFDYYEEGVNENSFYGGEGQKLHLTWRSYVKEGDMMLTLKSPSQEVVYTAPGNTNRFVIVPLTEGKWTYSVSFENASQGRYSLRGMIRK